MCISPMIEVWLGLGTKHNCTHASYMAAGAGANDGKSFKSELMDSQQCLLKMQESSSCIIRPPRSVTLWAKQAKQAPLTEYR